MALFFEKKTFIFLSPASHMKQVNTIFATITSIYDDKRIQQT